MKTTRLIFAIVCLLSTSVLKAQDYKFGAGVRLSTSNAVLNNSFTAKYFLNEKMAIEGILSFTDPFALGVLAEFHQPLNINGADQGLRWFYGAGGYVGFPKGDVWAGATGIVGLDYKFRNAPINLSVDWKPELNLVTKVNFEAGILGVSARFTFK